MEEKVKDNEVKILIESIRFDNEKIKNILNPKIRGGLTSESSYKEVRKRLKSSVVKREKAELLENEEMGRLLDDYELINSRFKNLGLLKIALDEAGDDLNTILKVMPDLSSELAKIKKLIKEREDLWQLLRN